MLTVRAVLCLWWLGKCSLAPSVERLVVRMLCQMSVISDSIKSE